MHPEPLAVTLLVIDVLEALGVTYVVGGSLASALYGVSRSTLDADIVAELRAEHAERLEQMLGDDFYLDVRTIRDAIHHRASFNVIHLKTMFKVDVFLPKDRVFDRTELERRTRQVIGTEPERAVYFASAEDIVLSKLEWFRLGQGISDRQWQDVLGVIRVQGDRLDLAYLRRSAVALGIVGELERALEETGLEDDGGSAMTHDT